VHHPFTSPVEEDVPFLESDPGRVRAEAYDMILNGVEVGGGSDPYPRDGPAAAYLQVAGLSDEEDPGQVRLFSWRR